LFIKQKEVHCKLKNNVGWSGGRSFKSFFFFSLSLSLPDKLLKVKS